MRCTTVGLVDWPVAIERLLTVRTRSTCDAEVEVGKEVVVKASTWCGRGAHIAVLRY
jgi:hypothetical protein